MEWRISISIGIRSRPRPAGVSLSIPPGSSHLYGIEGLKNRPLHHLSHSLFDFILIISKSSINFTLRSTTVTTPNQRYLYTAVVLASKLGLRTQTDIPNPQSPTVPRPFSIHSVKERLTPSRFEFKNYKTQCSQNPLTATSTSL